MERLRIGTTNPAKVEQINGALKPAGIEALGLDKNLPLPEIEENGQTPQENARKKALAYAKATGETVLSMDNALFINGLAPEEQPGMHVRRIHGSTNRPTDEEVLSYYTGIINRLGGNAAAHWEFAVCIADPSGQYRETTIISPRIFANNPNPKIIPGYPLEAIQVDPDTGKFISDMSTEEQALFWQKSIGEKLRKFVEAA